MLHLAPAGAGAGDSGGHNGAGNGADSALVIGIAVLLGNADKWPLADWWPNLSLT